MFTTKTLGTDPFERGFQLGDYALLEQIGRGGEGVIWSAWDSRRQRVVAMKIIAALADDVGLASMDFERQVHLLASLKHPHILPLYEFGSTDSHLFIVMRYNSVGSLANRLLGGAMDVKRVLQIAAQMIDALTYLHRKDIIHRDLKPNNILLDGQGRVYLSDFGLARHLTQATLPLHTGRGTGPYAPYEQHIQFNMSVQSDIFSMGVVLYELLTGQLPWEGANFLALLQKERGEELPDLRELRPELPFGLTEALRRMTAFRWQDRPATAVAALNLLLTAVPDLPLSVRDELKQPSVLLTEEAILAEDGDYLLDLFMQDWDAEIDEFPARLTHVAVMDATLRQRETVPPQVAQFMLRGAFVYGYRLDFWWQQHSSSAARVCVCEQTLANEAETAVRRALNYLRKEAEQNPISLAKSSLNLLTRLAREATVWQMQDDALAILANAVPTVGEWQQNSISVNGDVRLAELALADDGHALKAATIIAKIKSETAVHTLLDHQQANNQVKITNVLKAIETEAGSLPPLVPFGMRQKMRLARWREKLGEEREGFSVPRLLIGFLAGGLVSVMFLFGLFSQPAMQMQDVLLSPYPVSGIVTIVAIDDESLAQYGRWDAWPRSLHAQLINQLTQAGARAIALDIVFDAAASPEADRQLAQAIADAGMVVQPVLGQGDAYRETTGSMRFDERILPQDAFVPVAGALGHTNILHDEDGYVRRIPTTIAVADEMYHSLPLTALQVYLGGSVTPKLPADNHLLLAGRQIPVDQFGEMAIYYAGAPAIPEAQTFQMVSYQDVIAGNVPASLFKDKLVLVGITATSEPDSYLTPVSEGRPMFGVEILANVIETVWSEQFIRVPGAMIQIILFLLLGVLTGLVCTRPWSGLALALGVAVVYFGLVMFMFETQGLMFNLLYGFMTVALSYAFVTAYRFSVEVRTRRDMMQLFEMNVSPIRAQETFTAVKRGEISLSGQVQEVTVLCLNIRGHRELGNQIGPDKLISWNQQVQVLIKEGVFAQEGTFIQQDSEKITIIFNAPLPQPDHVERAVQSALRIHNNLEQFQSQQTQHGLDIQFGIYSGQALVGNVGSIQNYRYGAVGDAITIAAKLAETARPSQIVVGESIWEKVSEMMTSEPLPPVMIKNKPEPIPVFVVSPTK